MDCLLAECDRPHQRHGGNTDYGNSRGYIPNHNCPGPYNGRSTDFDALHDGRSGADMGRPPHMDMTAQSAPRCDVCMSVDQAVMIDACPGVDNHIFPQPGSWLNYNPCHDLGAMVDLYVGSNDG
jgi:hypothetical protein